MGMGISDVALGVEILRRAQSSGAGRAIPPPGVATPRFKKIPSHEETAA
jgi:alanine dehydrogenase